MHKPIKVEIFEKVLFENKEVQVLIEEENIAEAARLLLVKQKENWPFLNDGYQALKFLQTREITFDSFSISLQYNPNRITSSKAKVDETSVKGRNCFLCYSGLPPEQKGILYNGAYLILCNPYPIFPEHFTMPNINHFPQNIKSSFNTLLNLSKDLSEYYSVFYNGPQCGASAPDHLHFQAGTKMFLPVEKNFDALKSLYGEEIIKNNTHEIYGIDDGIRRFVSVESKNYNSIIKIFGRLYNTLEKLYGSDKEPPMNIISGYTAERGWRVLFFLRDKHRSSHYFKEGEERVLLSPGATDMGGICILPLEKDFKNLDKSTLKEIFAEVTIGIEYFNYVKSGLKKRIHHLFNFGS